MISVAKANICLGITNRSASTECTSPISRHVSISVVSGHEEGVIRQTPRSRSPLPPQHCQQPPELPPRPHSSPVRHTPEPDRTCDTSASPRTPQQHTTIMHSPPPPPRMSPMPPVAPSKYKKYPFKIPETMAS